MHSPPSLRAEPAPSAHSHTARSHTARSHIVAWRSAAVVALGAALGLGFYLMLYGAPAAPPIALAPTAAPPSTTKPIAGAKVEPAAGRSEERRVGKECVNTFRSRGMP